LVRSPHQGSYRVLKGGEKAAEKRPPAPDGMAKKRLQVSTRLRGAGNTFVGHQNVSRSEIWVSPGGSRGESPVNKNTNTKPIPRLIQTQEAAGGLPTRKRKEGIGANDPKGSEGGAARPQKNLRQDRRRVKGKSKKQQDGVD